MKGTAQILSNLLGASQTASQLGGAAAAGAGIAGYIGNRLFGGQSNPPELEEKLLGQEEFKTEEDRQNSLRQSRYQPPQQTAEQRVQQSQQQTLQLEDQDEVINFNVVNQQVVQQINNRQRQWAEAQRRERNIKKLPKDRRKKREDKLKANQRKIIIESIADQLGYDAPEATIIYDLQESAQEQIYPDTFESRGEVSEEVKQMFSQRTEQIQIGLSDFEQRRHATYERFRQQAYNGLRQDMIVEESKIDIVSDLLAESQVIAVGMAQNQQEIDNFIQQLVNVGQLEQASEAIQREIRNESQLQNQNLIQQVEQISDSSDSEFFEFNTEDVLDEDRPEEPVQGYQQLSQNEEQKIPNPFSAEIEGRQNRRAGRRVAPNPNREEQKIQREILEDMEQEANGQRPQRRNQNRRIVRRADDQYDPNRLADFDEIYAALSLGMIQEIPNVNNLLRTANYRLLRLSVAYIIMIFRRPSIQQIRARQNQFMQIIRPWLRHIRPAILILGTAGVIFKEIIAERRLSDLEQKQILQKKKLDDLKDKYKKAVSDLTEAQKNKYSSNIADYKRTNLQQNFPQCKRRFYIDPTDGQLHSIVECQTDIGGIIPSQRYYQDV